MWGKPIFPLWPEKRRLPRGVKIDEKQHVIHAVFFDRLRYICKTEKNSDNRRDIPAEN